MHFSDVPFGGHDADNNPVHVDKVWNDTEFPCSSFVVGPSVPLGRRGWRRKGLYGNFLYA